MPRPLRLPRDAGPESLRSHGAQFSRSTCYTVGHPSVIADERRTLDRFEQNACQG
ncbi:MAG: hypothetical protein AB2705_17125 [Candidatus Thiodiazotropha sp.]